MKTRVSLFLFVFVMAFFALGLLPSAAKSLPVVALAGVKSRVVPSSVTLTRMETDPDTVVRDFASQLSVELANDPRYLFYDRTGEVDQVLQQEQHLRRWPQGKMQAKPADYLVYGYLTDLSEVKAQNSVLGLGGKDKTIRLTFSLRVVDAHTGLVVYTTTASSRRKSELIYHGPISRHDSGQADAVADAVSIAAQNLAADFRQAL